MVDSRRLIKLRRVLCGQALVFAWLVLGLWLRPARPEAESVAPLVGEAGPAARGHADPPSQADATPGRDPGGGRAVPEAAGQSN